MDKPLYFKFSDYLMEAYGQKVYKLPINLPVTCPNRDGRLSSRGCIFCGEEGAGFEMLAHTLSPKEQLAKNAEFIGENYKACKFIAYFQNYSNTYLPIDSFKEYINQVLEENVVALYISTRPDCIGDRHLEFLAELKRSGGPDTVIELGLQTVNYHTLRLLERGHTLSEFIDAVLAVNRYGLMTCAHYITDLPMDNIDDVTEGAKIISALGVNQVKCHSMYILKGTQLGELYQKGEVKPVTVEEYIERTITFLEYLDPKTVIQRLIGRAPEERSLFCNWGMSWWKIRDNIENKMRAEGRYQGRLWRKLRERACFRDEIIFKE